MIQANTLIAGAAAIALSLGVTGEGTIPKELQVPLGNKDIVIVKDDVQASVGQTDGDLVKVFGWYDNEWGYTNRLLDLTLRFAAG